MASLIIRNIYILHYFICIYDIMEINDFIIINVKSR